MSDNIKPSFRGFMIVSLCSGSGKTITSIMLLNYLKQKGYHCNTVKYGPDYLDQKILAKFSHSKNCYNIDTFSMTDETISRLLQVSTKENELCLIEGAMGLFDGSKNNLDHSVTFCKKYNIAQILVVAANSNGQTIAYLVKSLLNYYKTNIKYLIINNISSKSHKDLIESIFSKLIPKVIVLAYIYKNQLFKVKSRYLGLATEQQSLDRDKLNKASKLFDKLIDQKTFDNFITKISTNVESPPKNQLQNKPGKTINTGITTNKKYSGISLNIEDKRIKIAIAKDQAFFFIYQHLIDHWKSLGYKICYFSPLNNQPIPNNSKLIYLPGGYPELYIQQLTANQIAVNSIKEYVANKKGKIYAECAGAIFLGKTIITKDGKIYNGLALTNTITDFRQARLHLGYRKVTCLKTNFLARAGETFKGHEFHYTIANNYSSEYNVNHMWRTYDACDNLLGFEGCCNNEDSIISSFIHIIDKSI